MYNVNSRVERGWGEGGRGSVLYIWFCHWFMYTIQTFQPPSHANLEVLKNKPRKTWRLGPQTWRLQKYAFASNKNNNDRLFVSEYSSLN